MCLSEGFAEQSSLPKDPMGDMVFPRPRLLFAATLGLSAFAAFGQQAAPAPSPAAPLSPVLAPQVAKAPASPPPSIPAAPARLRPLSPEIAAALAAAMPKYDPPAVPGAPPASPSPATPENGIIRMPAYIVHGEKVYEFTERELYTPQGLKELAVKRYISEFDQALNHYRIPLLSGYSTAPDRGGSLEARAMRQFEQDEAISRAAEMADLMSLYKIH